MWRVARVPRVPRVSCCTDSAKTPGNRTENPPSSRPCRDWPDCLAVGGVRSELVSSPRMRLLPLVPHRFAENAEAKVNTVWTAF